MPSDRRLEALAARQHGVISRRQALALGLSPGALRRRVMGGAFLEIHPGTFIIAGSAPSWLRDLWAAQAYGGDQTVLSHRSAGALWEFEGIARGVIEVTAPRLLRARSVLAHRKKLDSRDVRELRGLRVTGPARTLLDLGDVLPHHKVERALDDALHRQLVTLPALRELLRRAGGRGVRGTVILRALVEDRNPSDAKPATTLERRLARLIRRSDLPQPIAQYQVFDAERFVARPDFAYPHLRLAIEADGYKFHSDRQSWSRDLQRRTALASLGWRVLHFTWDDVHDRPGWVLGEIRRSLFISDR